MARRNDHTREDLKALILDTSWEIVRESGFEGLTARRIAKEIGYAPGTIYNLFNSMEDLYLALNARTLDLLYDALSNPACNNPKQKPINNMKAMATHYMDFAQKYRPYWLMLFNLKISEDRSLDKEYSEKIDRLFMPLESLLEPYFLTKGRKKRKIATRVLWAAVHGLCFLHETEKISIVSDRDNSSDVTGYLIDTFINGLKE